MNNIEQLELIQQQVKCYTSMLNNYKASKDNISQIRLHNWVSELLIFLRYSIIVEKNIRDKLTVDISEEVNQTKNEEVNCNENSISRVMDICQVFLLMPSNENIKIITALLSEFWKNFEYLKKSLKKLS